MVEREKEEEKEVKKKEEVEKEKEVEKEREGGASHGTKTSGKFF